MKLRLFAVLLLVTIFSAGAGNKVSAHPWGYWGCWGCGWHRHYHPGWFYRDKVTSHAVRQSHFYRPRAYNRAEFNRGARAWGRHCYR